MKPKLLIIFIFILAFFLRFWQLGQNPSSLDWDEASLGYNAYSILKTGRDEYGNFLPLSIRSFGDYKPAVYTYLTVIPVALFGLNEFSVRFVSAILGFLTVVVGYFLMKELFPDKSSKYYLLFSTFFALSPWHIQFSRIAFEANTALFFFILGIWLFLKGQKQGKFFLLSVISFMFSVYSYHSPRLIAPLLILGMTFIYRREIKRHIKWFVVALAILIFIMIPILQQLRFSTGARFGSVTVLNPLERLGSSINAIEYDGKRGDWLGKLTHNRRIIFAKDIVAGYIDHFNFDFLFLTGDPPGRHHAASMGMLYMWDLPFILAGIYFLLQKRDKNTYLIFLWFLLAPLASSLTTGTPHAVRALFYIPTYQIFATFGFMDTFYRLRNRQGRYLGKGISLFIGSLFIFSFFYYLHMYFIHTPSEYSQEWQYGYKQAVEEVAKLEPNYKRIIVTYRYDQPYVYFLFYEKIDPAWYQNNWGGGEIKRAERSFGKYEFRNVDWSKDSLLSNTLLVGTAGEVPTNAVGIIKEISFPDGSTAFRIVTR